MLKKLPSKNNKIELVIVGAVLRKQFIKIVKLLLRNIRLQNLRKLRSFARKNSGRKIPSEAREERAPRGIFSSKTTIIFKILEQF